MDLKSRAKTPSFWLVVTAIFYGVFEVLNSTIVCRTGSTTILTGLFSFLGFWSLVGVLITLIQETRATRRFSWLWLVLVGLIVILFLFDAYIGKTCFYN